MIIINNNTHRRSGLGFLFGVLGEKYGLDVGQHIFLSDGHSGQQLVQFLVISYGRLQMSGYNTGLFVVPGSVTDQFQNFGGQIFHDGSQIDGSSDSDAFRVVSLSQQTMYTSDEEL